MSQSVPARLGAFDERGTPLAPVRQRMSLRRGDPEQRQADEMIQVAMRAFGARDLPSAESLVEMDVQRQMQAAAADLKSRGIEPTSEAWEASILPLYDARLPS